MRKKYFLPTLSLCLLCLGFAVPALANDDWTSEPPVRPGQEQAAYMQVSGSTVDVVFLTDSEDAELEVTECNNGKAVYKASGTVHRHQRISVCSPQMRKGHYKVKVKLNGQVVKESVVHIK